MSEKRYFKENFYNEYAIKKQDTIIAIVDSGSNARKICDELNSLHEENEQLKQQIQQLQHWNKCLAEKRHQELSYRPYTASKSEKELKELLEPKLFNCSDR